MTQLRPVTIGDVEELEARANNLVDRGEFQWFGFATAGHMRGRVEQRTTIGDESGHLSIANDDGGYLGDVSWRVAVFGPPPSNGWEVGITVYPEHRGLGHGTRAQQLLCEYLFANTRAERIQAVTDIDNVAEQRSLAKAGFTAEGTLRRAQWRAGGWHDMVMFSRLRGEAGPSDD